MKRLNSCRDELLVQTKADFAVIVSSQAWTADEVGRHYDDLDVPYREVWGEHVHHGLWRTGRETTTQATEGLIDAVTDPLHLSRGQAVVDIGCGYGGTSRYLAGKFGVHCTGFTLSEAQFAYATAEQQQTLVDGHGPRPTFHRRAWEDNGLESGSIDAAVSIECFTHVPDKLAYFQEIVRVLKPGGKAALTVWATEPNPHQQTIDKLLEPIVREGRLAGMGSLSEYRELATAAGLHWLDEADWSQQVARTWTLCIRRTLKKFLISPKYWQMLLSRRNANREFAKTLFRIRKAYRTGAMRYGFILLQSPETNGSHVDRDNQQSG